MADETRGPDSGDTFPAFRESPAAACDSVGATFDGTCIILPEAPLQRWRPSDRLTRKEIEAGLLLNHRASSGPWTAARSPVEDWLIGTLGEDEHGTVYLTTDGVHASEMNGASALNDGEFIAWARNNIGRALRELERLYALEAAGFPPTTGGAK